LDVILSLQISDRYYLLSSFLEIIFGTTFFFKKHFLNLNQLIIKTYF